MPRGRERRTLDPSADDPLGQDPNPAAPFEIPAPLLPTMTVETIGGADYLFESDEAGLVRDVQFKTTDGVLLSVNFFGPTEPETTEPGGVDHRLAVAVVGHLG